jgi:hypothetical protein
MFFSGSAVILIFMRTLRETVQAVLFFMPFQSNWLIFDIFREKGSVPRGVG